MPNTRSIVVFEPAPPPAAHLHLNEELRSFESKYDRFEIGSIAQCECGQFLELGRDSRFNRYWIEMSRRRVKKAIKDGRINQPPANLTDKQYKIQQRRH